MNYIFDIECDDLYATKIHCFSRCLEDGTDMVTYQDPEEIKKFLEKEDLTLIGHNIVRYDIPTLERLLDIKIKARLVDTLPLSWYLEVNRMKHGLEGYGEDFGVHKVKIDDWQNLTFEEYKHRCEEDVKINQILWAKQRRLLSQLYDGDAAAYNRFIDYLVFKMDCLKEQEQTGLKLDREKCVAILEELEKEKELKIAELKKAMPLVPVIVTKTVPKILYKNDGSPSARGKDWFELLEKMGLPIDTESVDVIKEYEEPNPNSTDQLKKWLYSLGWVPEHNKFVRDKEKNTVRQIPQIASKEGGGEICNSVKKLIAQEPALGVLEGLSVTSHRISIFKGFLKDEKDGRLYAAASGLTNTLRLQHSVIVNLPSVERKYGKDVRGCLVADDGKLLCGSDLSGIEDNTKRHYIYKFDPKYVEEMSTEGYDAHLDIAMLAGFLTKEQVEAHKAGKENHKSVRQKAKMVNFCLPTDNTEVLTDKGWSYYKDLKVGDPIMSYNVDADLMEFTHIESIPYFEDSEVVKVGNKYWGVECTPNHRWLVESTVYQNRTFVKRFKRFRHTEDLKVEDRILNCKPYKKGNLNLTVETAELIGWVLADGHVRQSKKASMTSSSFGKKKYVEASVAQSNKKFLEDLRECVKKSGISYGEYTREDGVVSFNFSSPEFREFWNSLGFQGKDKLEINYTELIFSMSHQCREAFFSSFVKADGGRRKGKGTKRLRSITIYQNDNSILDAVELCANLLGYKTSKRVSGHYKGKTSMTMQCSVIPHTTCQHFEQAFSRKTSTFCCNSKNQTFVIRQNGVVTITGNSATYKVGAETLSRNSGMSLEESKKLLRIYWERNAAILKVEQELLVKTIAGNKWLLNPVSKFWYSLRAEKDRFSTLNQGTAVYVFDIWVMYMRNLGIQIALQYHDEVLFNFKDGLEESIKEKITEAIRLVNQKLKLNVTIACSVQFGHNYADCH